MNKHGRQAMETMSMTDPGALAQLADPQEHFSILGEQTTEQINEPALPSETRSFDDNDD